MLHFADAEEALPSCPEALRGLSRVLLARGEVARALPFLRRRLAAATGEEQEALAAWVAGDAVGDAAGAAAS